MKVLILSCNTGGGHNAAASALKESLEFHHHEAEVLDLMSLGRKHTSALVGGAYVKLVSVFPAGFGAVYQLGELVRRLPGKSPVYYANARLGKVLADYLVQNHFDAVVTTHLYPAETLTWMKQKGLLTIPCVAVATDYACIPFWEETNCDYYVIPHKDLIPEFTSYGIPEEKLLPLGIPVRPAFSRPASKEDVRRHLGLPEDAPLFLVMSGSMGFGKVHLLAHELVSRLKNGEQVVIICGNNKKRARSLRLQFHKNPNVHVVGFTRHVAEYMAAADVLFTKPGGLSSTEAAVRRVQCVCCCGTACRADLRSIVSFSGFAIAAQVSRFLPSVRLGSLLVSLVVCFRHLFSLREHEAENVAFTIQSLSAKIRENHKKD